MINIRPILVVDDNANDVELSLSALGRIRLKNEAVVVHDGVEALDYLRRCDPAGPDPGPLPALVLLDLKMPRMDGREVLQQIRSTEYMRSVPVVILTSSSEEFDIEHAYRLGANAYVVKPIAFEEFISCVAKIGVFWGILNEPPP